ncbi:hypothetical protein [Arsenicibacter rosenii]|uniref:Glycosyl transferase n=1 Tax=Arsenicibacter rosenii TaxID=1750698 RepID=A0A1S2VCN1_9BACT|nr:hypothetical protein [Arsenicibacter rosenii]OIN56517.1 hypothetical protein BLX24_24690 [Arsenicibacter rosenii]
MEAVFTIVAKNYIPLANILGDSIREQHDNLPFFIIVADEDEGLIDYQSQRYPIIPANKLGITNLLDMAFKYNVTEFCTAIKPFAFNHLNSIGYDKIIYFDPDIYVFNSLNEVFNKLSDYSMVVTPHFNTIEEQYTGIFREGNILFAGIFNFGFVAINFSGNGKKITNWWSNRLSDKCYADRTDGFHVDQKWADFLPVFFGDIYIERSLGYNMAVWNWHERGIEIINSEYYVYNRINKTKNEKLIFYHYSNYNFKNAGNYDEFVPVLSNKYIDIIPISKFYAYKLSLEGIPEKITKLAYSYAKFDNNVPIAAFHRRLYRQSTALGYSFKKPFESTGNESFYKLLERKKMLTKSIHHDKVNEKNYAGFESKLKLVNMIARLVKFLLGFERYALLCKFSYRYVRPENQIFLLFDDKVKTPFENENRYINL